MGRNFLVIDTGGSIVFLRRLFRVFGALVVGVCSVGAIVGVALPAHASVVSYWSADVESEDRRASGSFSNLRKSEGWTSGAHHKAQAGAHLPGGHTLYASWAEGWGFACHSYAAGQTLGAMIRNPHSVTIYMAGYRSLSTTC